MKVSIDWGPVCIDSGQYPLRSRLYRLRSRRGPLVLLTDAIWALRTEFLSKQRSQSPLRLLKKVSID
jgi:hypothetical protein